ncbi:MAG TPA: MarR family transcriptional regulator [Candidatus Dormibacteraeota bacterium]|nr:MarR family transcriptional regulator [Candidatus Dormibacteraeota bacterium]
MSTEEEGGLIEQVDVRLRRVTTAIDGLDQRAARTLGVNRTDLRLLDLLASEGPLTPAQLGRAVGMSSGGMTVAIDRLTDLGYVRRQPHPQDRRKAMVHLTPRLRDSASPLFGPLQMEVRDLLQTFPRAGLLVLSDFLMRWADAIDKAAQG